MNRVLKCIILICTVPFGTVSAQVTTQAPNLFWATPSGAPGYLGLRAITPADLPGSSLTFPLTVAGTTTQYAIPYFSTTTTLSSLASPGTTTTVLHGNVGGAPSFGAVNLSADVTGNLSVSNLNGGASAGSSTYWRGDGTWATPTALAATSGYLYATDYGADPTNAVDSTTALQAWITACQTQAVVCFLNEGTYKISAALNITSGIHITGAGQFLSSINMATSTQNGFYVTAQNPIYMEAFTITMESGITPTAGAGVLVDPGGALTNSESQFVNIGIIGTFNAMDFERAEYWKIDRCMFQNMTAAGVLVQNLVAADSGDSSITNSLFIYNPANDGRQKGIYQTGSGGLRVVNNKFSNGYQGYYFGILAGANTGSMVTVGNSFENQAGQAMFITQASLGSGTLSKWTITGNEILCFANCVGIQVYGGSSSWITGLTISGNVIQVNGTGGASNGAGIYMHYADAVMITGNNIYCGPSGGAGEFGVYLDSSVTQVAHSGNNIQGCTTAVSDSAAAHYTGY